MKKSKLLFISSICIVSLLAGCSKKTIYSDYMTLGEYKGLEVSMVKSEVSDDMIQEEIDMLLEDNAIYEDITDRAAKDGDTLNIDFTGTIDGKEFEDGSAKDYEVEIGSGDLMEEIETALIGMKVGDTKQVNATFSDLYDEALVGKEAVFDVKVNKISEKKIPDYDDTFISTVTEFSTVKEYEDNLKNELLSTQNEDNRFTAGSDALALVVENSTFTGYPQEIYDSCKATYDAGNQMYAEMFGMDIADLELSEEETKAAIEELIYEKMVVTSIAEKEGLEVSNEEYKEYIANNYEDYGYESAEDYENTATKEGIMQEILLEKVQNFLLDNAKITEISEDEYYGEEEDMELYDEDETYEDETSEDTMDMIESETLDTETLTEE